MKRLLTSVFLLIIGAGSSPPQHSERHADKVEYSADDSLFQFTALRASENGKTYQLIDKSKEMCLSVVDQRDFDGNGFVDALVENFVSCGGNGTSNTFFFASAFRGGRFELSDEFGDSWGDPVIERWKGRWSVVVTWDSEGFENTVLFECTQRFILQSGKAVQVGEWMRKEMKGIVEIRSEMFDSDRVNEMYSGVVATKEPDGSKILLLEYDLDGDGKKDQ